MRHACANPHCPTRAFISTELFVCPRCWHGALTADDRRAISAAWEQRKAATRAYGTAIGADGEPPENRASLFSAHEEAQRKHERIKQAIIERLGNQGEETCQD